MDTSICGVSPYERHLIKCFLISSFKPHNNSEEHYLRDLERRKQAQRKSLTHCHMTREQQLSK